MTSERGASPSAACGSGLVGVADEPGHGDVGGGPAHLGVVGVADDDGQHAGAVLAGGLGDQLLGPVGEADDARAVVDEDELVAQRRRAAPWPRRGAGRGWPSSSSASRSATASASSSSASMSTPARPLGTSPKAVSAE